MEKKNINERLLQEIKELDADKKFKRFLEELLLEENAGLNRMQYKEVYKRLINKYFSENLE